MRYFDRKGQPLTIEQWATILETDTDFTYRRVAYETIGDGIEVSTVWLGIDHQWGAGPPLFFETMVFVGLDEPIDVFGQEVHHEGTETYRWSSEAQALAGHDQLVSELRAQFAVATALSVVPEPGTVGDMEATEGGDACSEGPSDGSGSS
jgi:hypothetical protein